MTEKFDVKERERERQAVSAMNKSRKEELVKE